MENILVEKSKAYIYSFFNVLREIKNELCELIIRGLCFIFKAAVFLAFFYLGYLFCKSAPSWVLIFIGMIYLSVIIDCF